MTLNSLELRDVTLSLEGQHLIGNLNRVIQPGEILTIMGPSGSGKSSLLAFVAGVLTPAIEATGSVWLAGQRLDNLPTADRSIGILFQDPLLFPHMSVGENLAFALPESVNRADRSLLVEQALSDAGMEGFAKRDPATLSGGQQSRVSLLRTVLARPRALLLDEPYSRLDQTLRNSFRLRVSELVAEAGLPTLLVTHDPEDAPEGGTVLNMDTLAGSATQSATGDQDHA